MVVPLGPGKFYRSSLPRPRIYNCGRDRVDPPVPVSDALMSWAIDAHWSMGGLSFKRFHLQGRIEGNVDRLRKQKEKEIKARVNASPVGSNFDWETKEKKRAGSESLASAPKAMKRRKLLALFDEASEMEEELVGRRKMVRKLVGDFERVAKEKVNDVVMTVVEEINRESEEEKKKLKSGKKGRSDGESESGGGVGRRNSLRLAKPRSA